MADYRAIKGLHLQSVSSDNAVLQAGDIWYNSTLGKLRVAKLAGSWATGASLNVARSDGTISSTGTSTATIYFGGSGPGPSGANPAGKHDFNELWNGSTWTEIADINTDRSNMGGAGISTAALGAGGQPGGGPTNVANAEKWDGSSWTEVGDLNTARKNMGACGTNTAAIYFGGGVPPHEGEVELWNGTAWTEVADLTVAKHHQGACGTSTAALSIGGDIAPNPTNVTQVEEWNGSSWTETTDINTARHQLAAAGTTTAALAFNGSTGSVSVLTELYDGSSWTEVADMAQGRLMKEAGCGTSTAALGAGGYVPGGTAHVGSTEEWSYSTTASSVTAS